jgi:hypothetical protein
MLSPHLSIGQNKVKRNGRAFVTEDDIPHPRGK